MNKKGASSMPTAKELSLQQIEQLIALAHVVNEAAQNANPQAILFIKKALELTKQSGK